MSQPQSTLRILQKSNLDRELDAFLIDRRARGLSPRTVQYYAQKLGHLRSYLKGLDVLCVDSITAPLLRRFLLEFSSSHNPGGTHALYRALKAFFRWYELEVQPEGWRNPMARIRGPKVPQELLEPVELGDIKRMLATCGSRSLADVRDKAIILALLDTGCRASEFVALTMDDMDMRTGAIVVRHGKGRKARTVFLGNKARRALAAYLRIRGDILAQAPLFAAIQGERLRYESLRDIIRRRAARAGIPAPTLHSFRRSFALLSLRNGVDIYSLQFLMGHADLGVLRRYLAQTTEDLQRAHERSGPVDKLL